MKSKATAVNWIFAGTTYASQAWGMGAKGDVVCQVQGQRYFDQGVEVGIDVA